MYFFAFAYELFDHAADPDYRRVACWRGKMIKRTIILLTAIVAFIAIFAVVPASAQISAGPTWQDTPHQYHQRLSEIMRDMTNFMGRMTEEMSHTDLTPGQHQQMAQQMERMSTMMRRISGLVARPALKEADWQKLMNQMRKQMDEMMRDKRMNLMGNTAR